jgi:hypothetical protein
MKKFINFYTNLHHLENIYYTKYKDTNPYKVVISADDIHIYNNSCIDSAEICKFDSIKKLFIGELSINNNQKKMYNGNTILVETEALNYVYIGNIIYVFKTNSPIVSYTSDIKDDGVPIPYALDKADKVYIFENSTIKDKGKLDKINIISIIHKNF